MESKDLDECSGHLRLIYVVSLISRVLKAICEAN